MVEGGDLFLPDHFQNLPYQFKQLVEHDFLETSPWLPPNNRKDQNQMFLHGMVPYFGGKSILWSGWCPSPKAHQLTNWPEVIRNILLDHEKIEAGKRLLQVQSTEILAKRYERTELYPGQKELLMLVKEPSEKEEAIVSKLLKPVYLKLQRYITRLLADNKKKLRDFNDQADIFAEPANLAIGAGDLSQELDFEKFSTPGPILELKAQHNDKFEIKAHCVVTRLIIDEDGHVDEIETTKGNFKLKRDAKVILAMGVLPPTRLLQVSLSKLPKFTELVSKLGANFSAHFISTIVARVNIPKRELEFGAVEMGADYICGKLPNSDREFHIQLSSIHVKDFDSGGKLAVRYSPDVVASASENQLRDSSGKILFVCAILGELSTNAGTFFYQENKLDSKRQEPSYFTNSTLALNQFSEEDERLRTHMESVTFKIIEDLLASDEKVDYWNFEKNQWQSEQAKFRAPGLVHESSTMKIGESDKDPIDINYRPRGLNNVYVTGASLWPSGGSWNPTLSMCVLAQNLASSFSTAEV